MCKKVLSIASFLGLSLKKRVTNLMSVVKCCIDGRQQFKYPEANLCKETDSWSCIIDYTTQNHAQFLPGYLHETNETSENQNYKMWFYLYSIVWSHIVYKYLSIGQHNVSLNKAYIDHLFIH